MNGIIKFDYIFFNEAGEVVRRHVLTLEQIERGNYPIIYFGLICDKTKTVRRAFTGLQDISHSDIYEGDILEYFVTNSQGQATETRVIGEVYFEEGRFTAKNLGGINFNACLIIGNVYENKDLLTP